MFVRRCLTQLACFDRSGRMAIMITTLPLLAIQMVAVPVTDTGRHLPAVQDASQLSLVVAETVSETDPRPPCPDRNCSSLFLGKFKNTQDRAGGPVPAEFAGRVEMGSPYNQSYRLAMIVELRPGQEPLIRDQAGFGDRSHEACFEREDRKSLGWSPSAARVSLKRDVICVKE